MNDTLELINLEQLLDDEPPCESGHQHSTCTIHVTTRAKWCVNTLNICEGSATWTRKQIERGALCKQCGLEAVVCWTLIPV